MFLLQTLDLVLRSPSLKLCRSITLDSLPFHSASSPFWFTHMHSNDSSIRILMRFVHQFDVKFDFDLTTIFLSVIFFFSDYSFLTNPSVTMEKSESVVAKTRGEHRFRLVGK
ncbi:hypothetical protein HanRHA438_Chr10g0465291 [Helianthus annuus]|nr:hypothetical protein HanHA300_Chr10g0371841 [Helianthus annuus]KAJ0522897.1 hypothetical protein HanIR_Chr10g0487701 [Helianthus annuus]KAJ0697654.1 hypothetical protein HanLR1_Chr10g0371381 [Helianthus annuus]KAJ0880625.1 hypothetical protein HanRHA438_Chr10g0465291 [Helianthus annuus]